MSNDLVRLKAFRGGAEVLLSPTEILGDDTVVGCAFGVELEHGVALYELPRPPEADFLARSGAKRILPWTEFEARRGAIQAESSQGGHTPPPGQVQKI